MTTDDIAINHSISYSGKVFPPCGLVGKISQIRETSEPQIFFQSFIGIIA